jgi:sugar lactone lactonase YvrE
MRYSISYRLQAAFALSYVTKCALLFALSMVLCVNLCSAQTWSPYVADSRINYPEGVAVDGSGNVFISDLGNARIRKIDASTDVITTIAGTGVPGYSGDGGPATNAQLGVIGGVSVDASGNIYVADQTNHRIRKITVSTGIITTVAGNGTGGFSGDGGLATVASLNAPYKAITDASGNLYISDTQNNRVRKVNLSTGIITTITGNGSSYAISGTSYLPLNCPMGSPKGLAIEANGNLLIVVQGTYVFRLDFTANVLSSLIGTQNASGVKVGPSGNIDLDFANDLVVSGGNIYFNDGHRVARYTSGYVYNFVNTSENGGYYDGPSSALSSQLKFPKGVAADVTGNIYIADTDNHRIRKYSVSTGLVSTIVGSGHDTYGGDGLPAIQSGLYRPRSLVVDAARNLYFSDDRARILKRTFSTGAITTIAGSGIAGYSGDGGPATSAQIINAGNMAIDASGNLFFSDDHRVRKITISNGFVTTVAGTGMTGFSGDGGAATAAMLNSPSDLAFDTAGNLYMADNGNHRIRKINTSGVITTIAGTGSQSCGGDNGLAIIAQISRPSGLVIDPSGNIYVGSNCSTVRKISTSGVITAVSVTAPPPHTGISYGNIFADSQGNLYVAHQAVVFKYSTTTGQTSDLYGAGLDEDLGTVASAICADNQGVVYVSSLNNNMILRRTLGQAITFAALGTKAYGDLPFQLTATASSGLPVTYVSSDPTVATISGNTVTILKGGSTTITASQGGNFDIDPAIPVPRVLTINKASQTITINGLGPSPAQIFLPCSNPSITLNAISNSGLPITYTYTLPTHWTANGNTLTYNGPMPSVGMSVYANQAGNQNYNPAAELRIVIDVVKVHPSFTTPPTYTFNKNYGDPSFNLNTILQNSNQPVTVSWGSGLPDVVSINTVTGEVTILNAGSVSFSLRQVGNTCYNHAETQPFYISVNKIYQQLVYTTPPEQNCDNGPILTPTTTSGLLVSRAERQYPPGADVYANGSGQFIFNNGSFRFVQDGDRNFYPVEGEWFPVNINTTQGVTIETMSSTVYCTGATISAYLIATLAPGAVNGAYTWVKDGFDVSNSNNAQHQATDAGTYSARYELNGCIGSSNSISISYGDCMDFSLSPNPADNNFTIYFVNPTPTNTIYTIYSPNGTVRQTNSISAGTLTKVINSNSFTNGINQVKVSSSFGFKTKPISIAH